jgi:hypothetical protein
MPSGPQTPVGSAHRGFLFQEFAMRTYTKLIATIHRRQGTDGLRPYVGVMAMTSAGVRTSTVLSRRHTTG